MARGRRGRRRLTLILPRPYGVGGGMRFASHWDAATDALVAARQWACPTPGLLAIAALTGDLMDVELIDEEHETLDLNRGYDLVGMYAVTHYAPRAYDLARVLRQRGATVVLGGVHPSLLPGEAAAHADAVVSGEAEELWPGVVADYLAGRLRPLYRAPAGRHPDVRRTPTPRFDLLKPAHYRQFPVQTARGCPHRCEFCNLPQLYGHGYRAKTVAQVLAEVAALRRVVPRPTIYFTDDNFFVDRQRSRELVDALRPLGLTFYANCDISLADDADLVERARRAGLRQVLVGLESLSGKSLQNLNPGGWKFKRRGGYADAVRCIQERGVGVVASFVLGLDGDGPEAFDAVAAFARDTRLYGTSLTVQTPFPGTALYDRLAAEGRILTRDWNRYTIFEVVMQPRLMSVAELADGHRRLVAALQSPAAALDRAAYFKDVWGRLLAAREGGGGDG
jgi:radical SAM superfamily enzyme YgiQ (UPF0313 family)